MATTIAVRSDASAPLPRPRSPWPRRAAVAGLLAGTAVLYLWGLSASGWANAFYSAAAQAGSESWTAWFFGSSDAANAITVDKTPAALWVSGLSVRLFGLSSWSILVPQALMGVATVGLLHATVRRTAGTAAGLLAGAVLALTPVAVLMFRFNNPDALLTLLLVGAAYALLRAVEAGRTRWLVLMGVLIGFGFLTKMLQAFLVLPAFAAVWLLAAPVGLGRRVRDLLLAGGAVVVSAGWWVLVVDLWPAGSRPYIGGSQTNSVLELVLGYNGLGRLTGDEVGSVVPGRTGAGGGGSWAGSWGRTGLTRLFTSGYAGDASWLLPAALVLLLALLWWTRRAPRSDRTRAAALAWGGWLVVTTLVFSLMAGIFHSYYQVALAPAIGALIGIGAVQLWRRRIETAARTVLAVVLAGTVGWAFLLLDEAGWQPWLAWTVLVLGSAGAAGLLGAHRMGHRARGGVITVAVVAALAAPAAWSVATAAAPHTGAIPSSGPQDARMGGGPGMRTGGGPDGGGRRAAAGMPGRGPGGGGPGGGVPGEGFVAGGSILGSPTPSAELTALLQRDADAYTWVAATIGSNSAAGYQLASGGPVIALGGFNGTDPYPTLEGFRQLVAEGRIHYFVGGAGSSNTGSGGSDEALRIGLWVQEHFTAITVGGTTVYDLTA